MGSTLVSPAPLMMRRCLGGSVVVVGAAVVEVVEGAVVVGAAVVDVEVEVGAATPDPVSATAPVQAENSKVVATMAMRL